MYPAASWQLRTQRRIEKGDEDLVHNRSDASPLEIKRQISKYLPGSAQPRVAAAGSKRDQQRRGGEIYLDS